MIKKYRVIISPQAYEALENIFTYIALILNAPLTAEQILEDLKKEILSLNVYPARYALLAREPWHTMGYRRSIVKNYNIYYWIDEQELSVNIVTVLYSKQDQNKNLD